MILEWVFEWLLNDIYKNKINKDKKVSSGPIINGFSTMNNSMTQPQWVEVSLYNFFSFYLRMWLYLTWPLGKFFASAFEYTTTKKFQQKVK